ncbi:hypothetical protein ATP06_0213310 [Amycolatopsis regifaucium]|uniref:Phage holin family protein n=1 Tax=Amycolatopsis regifaucium TaxID=546365 RepID=A0ABX3DTN9_9PSEU|nr:hypothetical protein ATP06_0213310 [Amycolatopsis regifaucium]SFI45472.1 hypothetical protein SAMN04489731_110326 [Amycolatopsis regifaucium]
MLAEGSSAQEKLLEHINWQIDQLRRTEGKGRRDVAGSVLGFTLAVGFGYLAYWLLSQDGWWRWFGVVSMVIAITGLYGIAESVGVAERDHKGRRIKASGGSSEEDDHK